MINNERCSTAMRKFFMLAVSVIFLLTSGCKARNEIAYYDKVIFGMDTYITLRLAESRFTEDGGTEVLDEAYLEEISSECAYIVAKNDKLMSSHDDEAQIYGLNNSVDMILDADSSLLNVLKLALDINNITSGAYNPAIGALSELWNVTGGGPVPEESAIGEALDHISVSNITVDGTSVLKSDPDCKIDLGGIAKGYTAQEILEYLAGTDIPYGLVSMGGNIGVFGTKGDNEKYRVGICDPDDTESVAAYLNISRGFISVAGDYERYFEQDGKRYHHIIDPETGSPAQSGLRSVAVHSNNGAYADALSTALFVMGPDKALELYSSGSVKFEAVMITDSHEIILTDGLKNDSFELVSKNYSLRDQSEE